MASCMDDKQTFKHWRHGFCLFLVLPFLEGPVGAGRKGVQPSFILHSQVQTKINVNYDAKEVHEHSPSLSSWKKFFFIFFRRQRS